MKKRLPVKPAWVSDKKWMELSERERRWCELRAEEVNEEVVYEKLGFRCGRTWRYFLANVRKKVFGQA